MPARSSPWRRCCTCRTPSRWFLGVANLRGGLHGVVDLAGFLGVKTRRGPARDQARLVGFNQSLDINCVLLVDRLSGLRSENELTRDGDEGGDRPSFVGARYRDASARVWQELNLVELAGNDLVPEDRRLGTWKKEGDMSFVNKIKGWGSEERAG